MKLYNLHHLITDRGEGLTAIGQSGYCSRYFATRMKDVITVCKGPLVGWDL